MQNFLDWTQEYAYFLIFELLLKVYFSVQKKWQMSVADTPHLIQCSTWNRETPIWIKKYLMHGCSNTISIYLFIRFICGHINAKHIFFQLCYIYWYPILGVKSVNTPNLYSKIVPQGSGPQGWWLRRREGPKISVDNSNLLPMTFSLSFTNRIFIGPRSPGPIYVSSLSVTE